MTTLSPGVTDHPGALTGRPPPLRMLWVTAAAHFLFGGAVLAGVAALTEGFPHIEWSPRCLAALVFLGLIGTAAALLAWFVEAQRCALASLTTWTFLVPVFGLLIGIAVLGERPDGWTVSGIALVLLSMRVALDHPSQHPSVRPIPLESR